MRGAPRAVSGWLSSAGTFCHVRSIVPSAVQRLKTRSQFQSVLGGDKVGATAHFVLHRCAVTHDRASLVGAPLSLEARSGPLPKDDLGLGAMVPKRWARRAVTRNAIRRQIYDVGSQFESALPMGAHVVRLRASFDRSTFPSATSKALKSAVREELMKLFSDAAQRMNRYTPQALP